MKKKFLYIFVPFLVFTLFFCVSAICNGCGLKNPITITISPATTASSGTVSKTISETTKETNTETTDTPSASSTTAAENNNNSPEEAVITPSGAPQLTLKGGSGYLFKSSETVTGSADRDIWWNAVYFVPNSLIGSLGVLNSPGDVRQIKASALKPDQIQPVPGEVYAVEVTRSNIYAILRVLSIDSENNITFEYVYPFDGELLP